MKNIIKTAICLIVISSILLYSSISYADGLDNNVNVTVRSTASFVLIHSEISSTDYPYNYFTYECYITPSIILGVEDAYFTGILPFDLDISIQYPTGFSGAGVTLNYIPNEEEGLSSYYQGVTNGVFTPRLYIYFENYWRNKDYFDVGTIHYLTTIRSSTNVNPPPSLIYSITASIPYNQLYFHASPRTYQGQALVWKTIIENALANSDLNAVYGLLNQWKTTQDGYLADIELSVDDIELWLSYINSAQATLQNKVDLLYALEQTFPGYFGNIISLLQDIKNMNASDTAAESQMQNAEQELSQAVNDMEVHKPNINNVVNAGDQYMDSNITGAQGDTFFWLHGTNIFVTILTMAVTIGILGFVIYGKSG